METFHKVTSPKLAVTSKKLLHYLVTSSGYGSNLLYIKSVVPRPRGACNVPLVLQGYSIILYIDVHEVVCLWKATGPSILALGLTYA